MSFDLAQTFFLDPAVVKGATSIKISAVDIYVKVKPRKDNNKSGIVEPGIDVYVVQCENGIPVITNLPSQERAHLDYSDLIDTTDASIASRFHFRNPVSVNTGMEYAIIIKYDGNEDYELWTSKQGQTLVGTNQISPGPSGKYIGNFYSYISPPPVPIGAIGGVANSAVGQFSLSSSPLQTSIPMPNVSDSNWKPLADTDLKFSICAARHFANGVPVANSSLVGPTTPVLGQGNKAVTVTSNSEVTVINLPASRVEYIKYDSRISQTGGILGGEFAYQNTVYWPGGVATPATATITQGSDLIVLNAFTLANGKTAAWSDLFQQGNDQEYIVVTSVSHPGMATNHLGVVKNKVGVKKIVSLESNTVLRVSEKMPFSNAAAKFFKSPVGTVNFRSDSDFVNSTATIYGTNLLFLKESTANASVRFVNNTIEILNVTFGGTGIHSNTDYIYITGYEYIANSITGGYKAQANIVTHANGVIQSVYLSNSGCGFINVANIAYTIYDNTATIKVSTSTFTVNVGATMLTEGSGGNTQDTSAHRASVVINLPINDIVPDFRIIAPVGVNLNFDYLTNYYAYPDNFVFSGTSYYSVASPVPVNVFLFDRNQLANPVPPIANTVQHTRMLPSRSNEFIILDSSGSPANTANGNIGGAPSASTIRVLAISNSDFIFPTISSNVSTVHFSKYIINNDYSFEHTNNGNAASKHITKRVNFASGSFAEDIRVYLTAYRPPNTDIKVYARIHNSNDTDAFDDKDWTLLNVTEGESSYSSPTDENSYIELTYGFSSQPNSLFTVSGTVATTNASYILVGSNTNFTANIIANDVIKIYSPLFPNNYMISVVNAVINSTSLTIIDPVSNNNLIGSGFLVDKIAFPHQAFNNFLNDNVVRYYDSKMVQHDTYDTFALKVVLLATSEQRVPKIDDIRSVGVTS